jgi:SAM-dependent methyltransferase
MKTQTIQFKNGSTYERYMGVWSQRVGESFLQWLNPDGGWRWLDVGCGNGVFTEMIAEHTKPVAVAGVDPSAEQIAFAKQRAALGAADLRQGDAMDLPFGDDTFDAAVMPLVLFFVPQPAKGVAEMARVVAPGGWVTAYSWDLPGGGFPYVSLQDAMVQRGMPVPWPPNPDAARVDVLQNLWSGAGMQDIDISVITVRRSFADFEDYWTTVLGAPSVGPLLAGLDAAGIAELQAHMRSILPTTSTGQIELTARANAVKGRVRG